MSTKSAAFCLFLILVWGCALTLAPTAQAQTGTSRITGTITDQTEAVLAGATVTAKNEATGVQYTTTTTTAGTYTLPLLPVGSYTLTVEASGFRTFTSTGNVLTVGAPLVVNATMQVGQATEVVEVVGSYERIETSNAMLSGVVTRRAIVEDGVLTTWLLNTASAAQLGLASTGHASRGLAGPPGVSTHNLHLEPGERDLAGLMADAGSGLLITSMFGPSLNANTGDWSAGVSGFWFEGGGIAHPVSEITVAGNLKDLWARLVPGSDLEFRGSFNSPSLLFDAVAIAGK